VFILCPSTCEHTKCIYKKCTKYCRIVFDFLRIPRFPPLLRGVHRKLMELYIFQRQNIAAETEFVYDKLKYLAHIIIFLQTIADSCAVLIDRCVIISAMLNG